MPHAQTSSARTTSLTPPEPSESAPKVSPAERTYLRNQAKNIFLQGGSEEDVVNFVQTHMGRPLEDRIKSTVDDIDEEGTVPISKDNLVSGLSLNALQGITFGFGDEAVGSLLGVLTGEGAAGGIESYRERLQKWNAANPKKAFGAELLGGFLTGAGAARALGLGARAGIGAKLAGAAVEGAAGGAVAGAGFAEGSITDRALSALGGAAIGAVAAPVLVGGAQVAGAVLKPPTRAVLDRIGKLQERIPGLGGAQNHAEHFLLETLDAEGLSVEELRSAAHTMRANGVNPTLADVGGEGVLALLSETLGSRTPAKQQLAEAMLSRQAEQGARLSGKLFRKIFRSVNFGLRNAYDAVDELAAARAEKAAPLYEEAYQHVVPVTDRMRHILSNPKFRAAWEEGRRIAQTEELARVGRGLDIPDLPSTSLKDAAQQQLVDLGLSGDQLDNMLSQLPENFPETLPVRGLDYMKRGLDVVIKRGLKSEAALDGQEIRALNKLREELLDFADQAVTSYGQARAVWSGMSEAMDAVELGQEFTKKAPPVVSREIESLMERSPALADFYRLGAAQTLYETATGAASRREAADIANRVFGGRIYGAKSQDALRIQALFPDAPEVAEDFMRQVAAEARLSHTTKAVRQTRAGDALKEFEETVEGTPPNVRMTLFLTVAGAMQDAIVRAQKFFRRDVSDELAAMFTKGMDDPRELDLLLDKLAHQETRRLIRQKIGRAASTGIASAIGLLGGQITGSAR